MQGIASSVTDRIPDWHYSALFSTVLDERAAGYALGHQSVLTLAYHCSGNKSALNRYKRK